MSETKFDAPKPVWRAWTAEEVPVGMLIRAVYLNATPQRTLILGVAQDGQAIVVGKMEGNIAIGKAPCERLLKECEHSLDGGKTWQRCGVLVAAQ